MKAALRPAAEILTIGDELLKGSTLNSNAKFLGRELTDLGFRVTGQSSCPDDFPVLTARFAECLKRSRVLVLTGGLGPTPDDITREALAEYFGVPLVFCAAQYRQIEKFYKGRGLHRVPAMVRKEAQFPANAKPLVNRYGIALGFTVEAGDCLVIVLPGVPREQESMFRELVKPLLRRKFPRLAPKCSLTVKTIGLSEPAVMARLGKTFFRDSFDFGIYPAPSEASLRLQSEKAAVIQRLRRICETKLKGHVYAFADQTISETVGGLLAARGLSVSTAESCTGGALAAEITAVPGASVYFPGGVVTYSDQSKTRELGVSPQLLKKHGAVSGEVVSAMASGVRTKFRTDFALALSGVAGPGGGTKKKPVGEVWIGFSTPRTTLAWKFQFSGARALVQIKSVKKALEILWRHLRGERLGAASRI